MVLYKPLKWPNFPIIDPNLISRYRVSIITTECRNFEAYVADRRKNQPVTRTDVLHMVKFARLDVAGHGVGELVDGPESRAVGFAMSHEWNVRKRTFPAFHAQYRLVVDTPPNGNRSFVWGAPIPKSVGMGRYRRCWRYGRTRGLCRDGASSAANELCDWMPFSDVCIMRAPDYPHRVVYMECGVSHPTVDRRCIP